MSRKTELQRLLPTPFDRFSADLVAAVLLVVVTVCAAVLPGVRDTPLRIVLGVPFVLFVPGYAFVAALYPARDSSVTDAGRAVTPESDIDGVERIAFSFGTSIAITPLIGLVLNFTLWGITLVPILVALGGFTVVMASLGAFRHHAFPFEAFSGRRLVEARTELFEPDSRTDLVLNAAFLLSLLLVLSSVTYAVAVPKPGDSFTEFYVMTENDSGGFTADDYPTEFTAGQPRTLVVGIDNEEQRPMNYTVVATIQRVRNNTTRVVEQNELQRFTVRIEPGETWRRTHTVAPTMTGRNLRLTYSLYRGNAPVSPAAEDAYRQLHIWVNVTELNDTRNATADRRLSLRGQPTPG